MNVIDLQYRVEKDSGGVGTGYIGSFIIGPHVHVSRFIADFRRYSDTGMKSTGKYADNRCVL